ncbi:hypothetical protein N9Q58_04225 [Polaribacter sp.]|nr:hypothetical protein [Polaribacter sp.]
MKNLENFGVQELSIKEQKEVDGGFFGYLIGAGIALVAMGIHDAIDYPGAFLDGVLGRKLI